MQSCDFQDCCCQCFDIDLTSLDRCRRHPTATTPSVHLRHSPIHSPTQTYTCTHVHKHTYIHSHACIICTNTKTRSHTHTHTHTHTHRFWCRRHCTKDFFHRSSHASDFLSSSSLVDCPRQETWCVNLGHAEVNSSSVTVTMVQQYPPACNLIMCLECAYRRLDCWARWLR